MDKPTHLQYATLWITTCILLHAFAMEHEGDVDMSNDKFFQKGKELMDRERQERAARLVTREEQAAVDKALRDTDRDIELLEGKLKREGLKEKLFAFLYEGQH